MDIFWKLDIEMFRGDIIFCGNVSFDPNVCHPFRHKEERAKLLLRHQEELKQFQRPPQYVLQQPFVYPPFYQFQGGLPLPQGYSMQAAFTMPQDPGLYNQPGQWTQSMVPLMGGQMQTGAPAIVTTSSPPTLTSVSSVGHIMNAPPQMFLRKNSMTPYIPAGFGRVGGGIASVSLSSATTAMPMPPTPVRLNKSESFTGMYSIGLPDASVVASTQAARQRATTLPLTTAEVNNVPSVANQQADPVSTAEVASLTYPTPMEQEAGSKRIFSPTPSEGSISDNNEQVLTPWGGRTQVGWSWLWS